MRAVISGCQSEAFLSLEVTDSTRNIAFELYAVQEAATRDTAHKSSQQA